MPEGKKAKHRLEDVLRIFHAECGGLVTGPLEGPWVCTECGEEMRRLVSDSDLVRLRKVSPGKKS